MDLGVNGVAIRILGPLEFALGALALRPMGWGEVLELAERYRSRGHSPLVEQARVEAALRMLQQAGVLHPDRNGKLHLELERLHPAYQAVAKAAASAISMGLNGGAQECLRV